MSWPTLVADSAFVPSRIAEAHNLVSVFPRRKGDGAYRATLDGLLQRSYNQAQYIDRLLPEITPAFRIEAIPVEVVSRLVRPVLLALTSICLDRSLRIVHRLRQHPSSSFAVAKVTPAVAIEWPSALFAGASGSWHFNQDVIARLAIALGATPVNVFEPRDYPEYPREYEQRNVMFTPQHSKVPSLWSRARSATYSRLGNISSPWARFQSLGFSTDHYYLARRGLLGPLGTFRAALEPPMLGGDADTALRARVHSAIGDHASCAFADLLKETDERIDERSSELLGQVFAALLAEWYPTGFLERLSANLERAAKAIDFSKVSGLVGNDAVTNWAYIAAAAGRLAGRPLIGVQHGGHYGYIEDISSIGQSEYAHYDQMITWGWRTIESHLPHCQTIPLPNPRLSERTLKASYNLAAKRQLPAEADVLFLSSLFHRFGPVGTCGQARSDFVDEITDTQERMIAALAQASISVDHKPYAMRFVDLYPDHYERLRGAGDKYYRLLASTQKGLTVDLIRRRRIVLWDQIGTGTLECFTSGVPTIVFWARTYSRESEIAKGSVAELERQGVVLSSPDAVRGSIETFLNDPAAWMDHEPRRRAIEAFCEQFARADENWDRIWRNTFAHWPHHSERTPAPVLRDKSV